jgi:hypothetical protein
MNISGNEDTHKKISQFIGRDSDHVFAEYII